MDLKEYIASGVVEMYAMGVLTPAEKKEFEQRLMLYPELAAELVKVQEALQGFTEAHSRNPRPSLRDAVLEKALEGKRTARKDKGQVVRLDRSHSLTYKYLIAASLAALVVSTFASWFFYSRWDEAEDRYISLFNEKNQLAQNYNLVKNSFDKTYTDMMMMRDENAAIIPLTAMDSTHHYQARIYWNRQSKETYIDVLSLPMPDQGMQYQVWAMMQGQPVDAGVFTMVPGMGMQRVKNIDHADGWAVTLEPMGGSPVPSMDRMYLHSSGTG